MLKIKDLLKRGDTIIEVTFAITIFSLISVITIQLMDRDVAIIQGALETEMARNEIDAQAEALRFIHNAYLSERELSKQSSSSDKIEYRNLWAKLTRDSGDYSSEVGLANLPSNISQFLSASDCKVFYDKNEKGAWHNISEDNAFVINTRNIDTDPKSVSATIIQATDKNISTTQASNAVFTPTPTNPRIVYKKSKNSDTNDENKLTEIDTTKFKDLNAENQRNALYDTVARAEGIWVISVRDVTKGQKETPEFYDFHIRACWFAPGHDRPSTIGTTIRLYNPELIEAQI